MGFTSAALTTELNTDPKSLGYAAYISAGNDTGLAALVNSTYAGVGVVYRADLMPQEVLKSLVYSELITKTSAQLTILQMLLAPRQVDAGQQNIRDIFIGIFPSGTSLANLDAVAKVVNPTRGEELWGSGFRVTVTDVAHALGR